MAVKPIKPTRFGGLLVAWLVLVVVGFGHPAVAGAQQVTISGRLHVIWVDPQFGPPGFAYELSDDQGRTTNVVIADELVKRYGGPRNLSERWVTVTGELQVPEGVAPGAAAVSELRANALSVEPQSSAPTPPQ